MVVCSVSKILWFFSVIFQIVQCTTLRNETDEGSDTNETIDETKFVSKDGHLLFWTLPEPANQTEGIKMADVPLTARNDTQAEEDSNTAMELPENQTEIIKMEDDDDIGSESPQLETPDETTEEIAPDVPTEEIQNSESSDYQFQHWPSFWDTNEKIVLARNNCNMELSIDDSRDTKLVVMFEPSRTNMTGKCCIALNGRKNSMLAVFIHDVHLQSRREESLQVVLTHAGIDFVLKRYEGNERNEPESLLLTESHLVYLILYYNVKEVNELRNYSHFNLEVFTYDKPRDHNPSPLYSSAVDNIFITTEEPTLFNNYYFSNNKFQ